MEPDISPCEESTQSEVYHVRPRFFERLSEGLGIELWVQEDYLLPFPFAGNKWIKLIGEFGSGSAGKVYITNGGLSSNHCRTVAMWAAFHGRQCHLVLHNDANVEDRRALGFLDQLGATYSVVKSEAISERIIVAAQEAQRCGFESVIIPGGGHSTVAVQSYAHYAAEVLQDCSPQTVVHASGTGGTQAGICIANQTSQVGAQVVGISVARSSDRGTPIIRDMICEASGLALNVDFRDGYVDGGYGPGADVTKAAVMRAGAGGLLLDLTYTGKAFAGLLDMVASGEVSTGSRVLFWHTGGSYLVANADL